MAFQSNYHNNRQILRVGSRTSPLALKQTKLIINCIEERHSNLEIKLVTMDTIGDKILDKELSKIGDKSLFTKELELALLAREVDFVVHSLKDVPTTLPNEFVLGCICLRESTEDAVVMRSDLPYKKLADLPEGSVVGTSSVRRVAQLRNLYPHLSFSSVRGNLNTRLMKLDDANKAKEMGKGDGVEYSALILAKAGLERLDMIDRITEVLSFDDTLYAVGQGALACECRSDDFATMRLLASIHDEPSALTSIAERSLMRHLDGGCSTPIAVRCKLSDDSKNLSLVARVMSVDGSEHVEAEMKIMMPENTDVNVTVHNKNGCDNDCDDVPPAKRRRASSMSCGQCGITTTEVELSRNVESVFLGLKINPICEIGRLRMAVSQRLGLVLANKLLSAGGGAILSQIKRTDAEMKAIREKDALASNV